MTDPASIVFGVIGTAAIALHSARRVKELLDSIEGAPSTVSALSKDVIALGKVLEILDTTVKTPNFANVGAHTQILTLLHDPLQNCTEVLNLLDARLTAYTKASSNKRMKKWRGLAWAFREKEFLDLQTLLISYKTSLDIAISATNLYSC
jgi:Fungal N-terminal domain of STAND proteins